MKYIKTFAIWLIIAYLLFSFEGESFNYLKWVGYFTKAHFEFWGVIVNIIANVFLYIDDNFHPNKLNK